jgi:hypothetical protein
MGSKSGNQLPVGASVPTWAILLGAIAVIACIAMAAKRSEQPILPAPEVVPSVSTS